MSVASYRRNVERKVTGPGKATCLPASMEQVSPYALPGWVYGEYMTFNRRFDRLRPNQAQEAALATKDILNLIVGYLGGMRYEDLVFKRANTAIGLKRIIHRLVEEDHGVVIDIDNVKCRQVMHSIGLIKTDDPDSFFAVSNHLPKNLDGPVPLDYLAKRLAIDEAQKMKNYPHNNANIMALPPV